MMLAKMPSAKIHLRESGGGFFEITVDGKLAHSKKATSYRRHPRLMNRPDPSIQGERVAYRVLVATLKASHMACSGDAARR
jgi:hypothetical protein